MEMINCPNCGKLTGFKRALGFGTLFMVVLTLGLWLLVIPMYPPRCINCGLQRNEAFWKNVERVGFFKALTPSTVIGTLALVAVVLLLFTWRSSPSPERRTPAPIVKGPDYSEPSSPMATTVKSVLQIDNSGAPEPGSALAVEAGALLASFQGDGDGAQSKYEGRRVAVTGAVTGVFVPPPGQVIKMAEKGLAATAFVTMGGPRIASPEESLMLPGITAYSEDGSLFGQQTVLPIRVGQVVTLVCRCNGGHRVLATVAGAGTTYSVLLKDCVLEAPGAAVTPSSARPEAEPVNLVEAPQIKKLEKLLFGERATEIDGYTTGSTRLSGPLAVIEFCKPHDCGNHGGMLTVDVSKNEPSTGNAAGIIYDESEVVVYIGDYGNKENLPPELLHWIADEEETERISRHYKNVGYVYQDDSTPHPQ
jgi:hypothetical protein